MVQIDEYAHELHDCFYCLLSVNSITASFILLLKDAPLASEVMCFLPTPGEATQYHMGHMLCMYHIFETFYNSFISNNLIKCRWHVFFVHMLLCFSFAKLN